jgi:hypothetical protein
MYICVCMYSRDEMVVSGERRTQAITGEIASVLSLGHPVAFVTLQRFVVVLWLCLLESFSPAQPQPPIL